MYVFNAFVAFANFVSQMWASSVPEVTPDIRCCGPNVWEAVRLETSGIVDKTLELLTFGETRSIVHYDYEKGKMVLEQVVFNITRNETYKQNVHFDYNKKLKWTLRQGKCLQETIHEPMPAPCIRGEAKYVESVVINGIEADVWAWNDTLGGSTWSATVTSATCIQLLVSRVSHQTIPSFTLTVYDNITSRIKDYGVFWLPSNCLLSLDSKWL